MSTAEVAKGACSKHFCDVGQLLSALVRAGDCTWPQPPPTSSCSAYEKAKYLWKGYPIQRQPIW